MPILASTKKKNMSDESQSTLINDTLCNGSQGSKNTENLKDHMPAVADALKEVLLTVGCVGKRAP